VSIHHALVAAIVLALCQQFGSSVAATLLIAVIMLLRSLLQDSLLAQRNLQSESFVQASQAVVDLV
jgi:hypothetical protein